MKVCAEKFKMEEKMKEKAYIYEGEDGHGWPVEYISIPGVGDWKIENRVYMGYGVGRCGGNCTDRYKYLCMTPGGRKKAVYLYSYNCRCVRKDRSKIKPEAWIEFEYRRKAIILPFDGDQ